ncbi:MAG: diguanylate cyclase [Synergistaceae bacterium]|nr:diguanylate cyclase [Synergistaceae bacterium]
MGASLIPNFGNRRKIYLIALTLCAFLSAVLLVYTSLHRKALINETSVVLSEVADNSAKNVGHHLRELLGILKVEADFISERGDIRSPAVMDILKKQVEGGHFSNVWVTGSDGISRSVSGQELDVSNGQYIRRAMRGEANISPMLSRSLSNNHCILFSVPIFRGGKVVGVLTASVYRDKIYDLFKTMVYGGRGSTFAVEKNGTIIAQPNDENFDINKFEKIISGDAEPSANVIRMLREKELLSAMRRGENTTLRLLLGRDIQYVNVTPIGLNDWYLLTVVPESAVMERFSDLTTLTIFIIIALSLLFIISVYLVVRFFRENTETIREDLETLSTLEERYETAMRNAAEYVFEWNKEDNMIYVTPSYIERFGKVDIPIDNVGRAAENFLKIYPEDTERYHQFVLDVLSGRRLRNETEIRLKTLNGEYVWCRIQTASVIDADGRTIRVLGSVRDIDMIVKERMSLKRKAELDGLTGIYDKDTTESEIVEYFTGQGKSGRHVLFIADVDNFKGINDTYGHYLGDAVLGDIAVGMRRVFRESDIIGRIGGDEFMVLMKNVNNDGLIHKKALEFRDVFIRCAVGKTDSADFKVSGSIGIAIYPEHGRTFDELYKKADHALYAAKTAGKNAYVIYDEAKDATGSNDGVVAVGQPENIPTGQKSFEGNIEKYLFHILNTSRDTMEGIRICFGMICNQLGVTRGQVFLFEDDDTIDCVLEWLAEDALSTQEGFRHFKLPERHPLLTRFDDSDIFFVNSPDSVEDKEYSDTLRAHGIIGMLQSCFREKGKLRGFLSFDECLMERREPSPRELEIVATVSEIIGTYLLKDIAISSLARVKNLQDIILDNVSEPIYIIDWSTHKIEYMNSHMKEFFPKSERGMKCYETLTGQTKECENCPIPIMDDKGLTNYEDEIFVQALKIKTRRKVLRVRLDDGSERGIFCFTRIGDDSKQEKHNRESLFKFGI